MRWIWNMILTDQQVFFTKIYQYENKIIINFIFNF